ncbi:MAG: ABC transporter substrate-binding protein [Peptococcaceae bacterium BICA1-8]|nr:MAG: ABC transporter substrate-binding protein [Peptococcaceae bacterium BICA1-8]
MKSSKKVLMVGMFLLAVTLVFSGCGQDKGDALVRVQKAGEISFAMSGGYPPFNYYDDKNELVGFDVDVSTEVAKRLGVEFSPVTTDWSGIIEGLRSGVYDGILGSMAVTDERKEKVDFSVPYYYSGAQLVVKENSPYNDPADLKGKIIGVVTGTTFESDAEKLGAGEIKLYKDDNQTLMEVNSGAVDAVITDRVVGVNAINSGKFKIKLLGNPLRSEDIAVAFSQSDDSLREAVDKILNEMHEDGTLKQLSEKWLQADITKK